MKIKNISPQTILASDTSETLSPDDFSTEVQQNSSTAIPDDIQWAPPGRHTINATRGGKPWAGEVNVTKAGAAALQNFLQDACAAANRGEGDVPYFDFNHDDDAASAHPTLFYWGGDDPKSGGIRVKVAWTEPGKAALEGRAYGRFSPALKLTDAGEIIGSDINMGGLVNRSAFTKIQPILSKGMALAGPAGSFLIQAKAVANEKRVSDAAAFLILARDEPWLYADYCEQITGHRHRDPDWWAEARCRQINNPARPLVIQAKAIAIEGDVASATLTLCRKNPALYDEYRKNLLKL